MDSSRDGDGGCGYCDDDTERMRTKDINITYGSNTKMVMMHIKYIIKQSIASFIKSKKNIHLCMHTY